MGKIRDYLLWRGDLSFSKDPLNDVDTLILALLSYLPFKDIVPGIGSHKEISLKDACRQYSSKLSIIEVKTSRVNATGSSTFDYEVVDLLNRAANCPRFEDIRLSNYDENTDFVIGRQFAAVTFSLPDPQHVKIIAFRGTDNSLIGWKEDFNLACLEQIPAQESASKYLETIIDLFPDQVIVCGHSKGGNLSVFAGSHLNSAGQSRLTKIINYDGPGFDFSIAQRDPFVKYEHKIINYVPEESMVGLLLDSIGKRKVVISGARFVLQHDAFNWEIERSKFAQGILSKNAKLLEQTLKTWLTEISISEREMFLEALFDILGASEGNTIKVGAQESLQEINRIMKKYAGLDKETKAILAHVFESLTAQTKLSLKISIKEKLPQKK